MAKKPAPKPRAPKVPKGGLPGRVASPREMFDSKVAQRMAAIEKAFGSPENFAKPPKGGLPGTVAKPKVAKPKPKMKPQLPDTMTARVSKALPKSGLPSSKRPLLSDPGLPGTVSKPKPKPKPKLPDTMGTRQLKKLPNYGLPSSGRSMGGGGGAGGMGPGRGVVKQPRP